MNNDVTRVADELRAGGEVEIVGLKSLRGYSPTYVEIDGVPVEWPQPERREATGLRVRRANGEIALYLTTTMERARWLLAEARRTVEAKS